jgi:hypothetical protein
MGLINKFHKMESKNDLFSLGKDINLPFWDIIRYNVYLKYNYPEKDRTKLSHSVKHGLDDYYKIFKKFISFVLNIFILKNDIIILTASRYTDKNGKSYDKSALPIIKALNGNCIILEPFLGGSLVYDFIYDFSNIFRRFFPRKNISLQYFNKVNSILVDTFGSNLISYEEINKLIQNFHSDYFFYKLFFFLVKNKKLIICTGNPKASILAANKLNIDTYLVQHAGIENDEIDYSYPYDINRESFILFPDFVLTFGDYWCKGFNVPAKKIVSIGNDFFSNIPNVEEDGSILVASTIVHGGELKEITLALANEKPNLNIVFKLHPDEFKLKSEYLKYFENNSNVKVISTEIDTSILIAKSQLVILIVSAVIYEALNQNKKVAILEKINYKRQLNLIHFGNIYFFNSLIQLSDILSKKTINIQGDFYKKTDSELLLNTLYNENRRKL